MSDLLAERAIELVAKYLPLAVKNGTDLEARTNMSFACLIAGMSFNDATPHFGHAFGHTLGSSHHIPHGIGCAIAQPGVIEIVTGLMPEKVRRVGELMGLTIGSNVPPAEIGRKVADRIRMFNNEVGVPTLKQLDIKASDLAPLADAMTRDVCFIFLPVSLGTGDVLKVIEKAYAL